MTANAFSGSDQLTSDDGQSPLMTIGSDLSSERVGERPGEVIADVEESKESLEAHAEVSSESAQGQGEWLEASAQALAEPVSVESAAGDLAAEGLELAESGEESGPIGDRLEVLPDAGSALEGGEEFLPILAGMAAKLGPVLLSAAGPRIARAITLRLSPKAKRILANARPGGDTLSVLQKLITQALNKAESGEESIDEALVVEMTEAIEIFIEIDNRVRIENTTKVPWRRYCALSIEFPSGALYRGTGFFIGKRAVATAGQCVYLHNQGGWARRIRVIPACDGKKKPFGSAYATSFRSTAGWTKNRLAAADYGAIILPSDAFPGQDFGGFALRTVPTSDLLGVPAVVAGYPGDKPFAELWGAVRKIKAATAVSLIYDIDTMGGQSGAPVYIKRDGERVLVGIHNYSGSTSNSAMRVTNAVINNLTKWGTIGASS